MNFRGTRKLPALARGPEGVGENPGVFIDFRRDIDIGGTNPLFKCTAQHNLDIGKKLYLCQNGYMTNKVDLSRYPPSHVREILRSETGFVCAIPGCNIPFLEFDHFDPEWKDKHHHNPDGMVALCPNHHAQARTNWTVQDFREFKRNGRANAKRFEHKLEYLKRKLCTRIGSNYWNPNSDQIMSIDQLPVLWFNRLPDNRKMINVVIRDKDLNIRLRITDNVLTVRNDVLDIECTPNGKSFKIRFKDGSNFRMWFRKQKDHNDLPEDMIEVQMKLKDLNLDFQANMTRMKNGNGIGNSKVSDYNGWINFSSGLKMEYKSLFKGHEKEEFIYEEIDRLPYEAYIQMFAYFLEDLVPENRR